MTQLPDTGKVTLKTFAGKHKYLTGAGCVLSGISAVISLVPYLCMWKVIKLAVLNWPEGPDGGMLVYWGWMAVASSLLSMLIYFGALMCTHISAFRTARNMKTVALHHLTELPIGYFKGTGSGKLRRIIDDGAGQTETYLAHQLPDLAGALVTPAAVLVLLLVFDWRFGLISLIPMAAGAFFLSRMMGTGMAECMRQYQNALEDMNNEAVEYVRGIPVVKTFQQSIFSFKSFHDSIMRYKDWAVNYTLSLRIPMCCYSVSINGIFAVLIPAGLLLAGDAARGEAYVTTVLDLVFYILFTPVCVTMMDKIMWTSENTVAANDALERILNIIREKPLPEPGVPRKPENHRIEIKDVSFSYNKDGVNALDHVSLTVPQGATAAMVGASGSGKTTLVSLIPRFFDVDRGSICIGGVDVRDMGTKELMKQVSFVFQDSRLFKDSLLNNIRAARPKADKEEVMRAVKAARCEDIIEKMPQGLDTVVGTKGVYLSGGEMQRIALARAILKDAPIVLLDEATAFADPDNEYLIQQAFEKLVEGKTVIMIAHRLSTVCRADCIFVMEEGRVAEQGNHDELLKARGLYAKMWKDYQTSVEWKVGGMA
ncbi:ABC transporter ATP-binding protein [Clostridium sp. 1001283B150225_161107_B6]|nr:MULTISPECIES: ABC transporter ATP-binding protein [Clostridia]